MISHAGLTSPDREIVPKLRRLPPFDLVFDARTQWQHRAWLREVAPGRYAASLRLPAAREPKDLVWLVGSRSLDAPLAAHRLAFDVVARGRP